MKSYTSLQKLLEAIGLTILIVYLVSFFTSFSALPDKIPAHYNFSGETTRYGSKYELLVVPILGAIFYLVLTIVQRYPNVWNVPVKITEENKEQVYSILLTVLIATKVEMIGLFALLSYYSSNSINIPIGVSVLFIIVPTITIIIGLIKVFRLRKV